MERFINKEMKKGQMNEAALDKILRSPLQAEYKYYDILASMFLKPDDFESDLEEILNKNDSIERLEQFEKILFIQSVLPEQNRELVRAYLANLAKEKEYNFATENVISAIEIGFENREDIPKKVIDDIFKGIITEGIKEATGARLASRKLAWQEFKRKKEKDKRLNDISYPAGNQDRKEWYSELFSRISGYELIDTGKKKSYNTIMSRIFELEPTSKRQENSRWFTPEYNNWIKRLAMVDRLVSYYLSQEKTDYAHLRKDLKYILEPDNSIAGFFDAKDRFKKVSKNILKSNPKSVIAISRGYEIKLATGKKSDARHALPRVALQRLSNLEKKAYHILDEETARSERKRINDLLWARINQNDNSFPYNKLDMLKNDLWATVLGKKVRIYEAIKRENVRGMSIPMYDSNILEHLYVEATNLAHYFIRELDREIMKHIRRELTLAGFYKLPEVNKKYKIYAAIACGPATEELKENAELFPDHVPVLVDKYFSQWKTQAAKNVVETFGKDCKYGSVSGDDADFLKPNQKFRDSVINAAKESGAIPHDAKASDVHIVYRLDQTLFNFEDEERQIIMNNIIDAVRKSNNWDEFYLGVARTPQPVEDKSEHELRLNMELRKDTDYSKIQNAAYMLYVSSILLGIPLEKSEYFSKFVIEETYSSEYARLNKRTKERPKSCRAGRDPLFDIGVKVKSEHNLEEANLEKGLELSFIKSRRPLKNAIKKMAHQLKYEHITSCNHWGSPESIIAFGRVAEMLRALYHVDQKGNLISFFNNDGSMVSDNPDADRSRRDLIYNCTLKKPENSKHLFFHKWQNDKSWEFARPIFNHIYLNR